MCIIALRRLCRVCTGRIIFQLLVPTDTMLTPRKPVGYHRVEGRHSDPVKFEYKCCLPFGASVKGNVSFPIPRSGAGDEHSTRLAVLCLCAIDIAYGLLWHGCIHLWRGKKILQTHTHTLENYRKLSKCSISSRGQWFSIGVYMINTCGEYA